MSHTLFISDVHLAEHTKECTNLFLTFLEKEATNSNALYILGDFFDAWLGDDDPSDYIQPIINALNTTSKKIPIFILPGNHDFLLSKQFAKAANITLLDDPSVITLYGKTILLTHGDLLCADNWQYQLLRKIYWNRFLQRCFLSLPLSLRKKISTPFQYHSTKKKIAFDEYIKKGLSDAASQQFLKKYQADIMIHGHMHRTYEKQFGNKIELSLGAWHKDKGHFLKIDESGNYTHLTSSNFSKNHLR